MRTKCIVAFFMIGVLLLSGCGGQADPSYDTAPTPTGGSVTVNGVSGSVYEANGTEYIKGKDLAEALGGTIQVFEGEKDHQAVITVGADTYSFTTYEGEQTTSAIYYFKNCLYDGIDWYCPRQEILAYLDLHELHDGENIYYTAYPKAEEIPTGVTVPVLMYHAVSDDCWGIDSLFVSPASMEEQLQYLTENGYTPIWFEDLAHADQYQKPVMLTFDDGYSDNYTELFPLLKKYQVKATVFMITGSIGSQHYLTEEQIREMSESGLVSIQSHTVTHEYLSTRSAEQLEEELSQSKLALTRITGKEPFVLCYPTGKYSEDSITAAKRYYQFGLLMSGEPYVTGSDPMKICRKYVSRRTALEEFIAFIQ